MASRLTNMAFIALLSGCATFSKTAPALPTRHSVVREQLVIYSTIKLARHHRLFDELVARRGDITQKLDLPISDEPINVYLFDASDTYHAYMVSRHPQLPERRAFFVESDTDLTVYAYWGDRVAEDLRHEVTHAYLHAVVPNLPLWLDEGLAEYFEVPRGYRGLNSPHLQRLLDEYQAGRWKPDLARLEQFIHAEEMEQLDYAESWAWMHFLMETTPRRLALLQEHMGQFREKGRAEAFSTLLQQSEAGLETALILYLRSLTTGNS